MICTLCPRQCTVDRAVMRGFCGAGEEPAIAKALIHMWEEPPISGTKGSGTVFFAGCNMRCVFCQNHRISRGGGKATSMERLTEVFFELAAEGAHNINLVTPTHYLPQIAQAISLARTQGFILPFVYNTSAYETVEALKMLDGLVDIYLPDIKYFSDEAAIKYSNADSYFKIASAAALEMHRQVGELALDANGIAARGMIIRHLILPGLRHDSMRILDWISQNLPQTYISLMAQYIPVCHTEEFKEINRKITTFEYDSVVEHFFALGLKNGFMQNRNSAIAAYVPDFRAI